MAIVKRKNAKGGVYYFNNTTNKFASEASYNRGKGAAKSAKTQFKTTKGYACSKAGKDLVTKRTSSAGKKLRTC
jgi:hypothetical protein